MNSVEEPFGRLVLALGPWLEHIVIIGGKAHELYRTHRDAQAVDYQPLRTLDTDVAISLSPPHLEPSIGARLMKSGFSPEFLGGDRPPAAHYRLRDEDSGFYVEFVAPLIGARHDRQGRSKATVEISGIASQRLRHIEVLLCHPWLIDFESGALRAGIRIANPVSFLAQKVLIHAERKRDKRAKDILYIHDTIEVFGSHLAEQRGLWRETVAPQLHSDHAKSVSKAAEGMFGQISDDIRRAALIARERQLSPEAIRKTCEYGMSAIFARV